MGKPTYICALAGILWMMRGTHKSKEAVYTVQDEVVLWGVPSSRSAKDVGQQVACYVEVSSFDAYKDKVSQMTEGRERRSHGRSTEKTLI